MRVPVPSGKPSSNRQRSSRPGASPTSIRHNRDGRFSQEPPRAASRRACATSGSRDSAAGMSPSATAAAKVGTSHNLVSAGSSDRSSAIRHRLSQNAANEAAGGGVREHCPGTRPNAVPRGRKATRPNSRLVRVGQPFRRPPSRLRPVPDCRRADIHRGCRRSGNPFDPVWHPLLLSTHPLS